MTMSLPNGYFLLNFLRLHQHLVQGKQQTAHILDTDWIAGEQNPGTLNIFDFKREKYS